MGLKNESQFYIFELKLSLTGRFIQNNSDLTDEKKEQIKRTFFDNLLKNHNKFKNEFTITNLLNYLNTTELTYSLTNSLIKFEHFHFIDEANTTAACLFFFANKNIQANDLYDFNTDSERKIEQQDYEGVRIVSHMILRMAKNPITNEYHLFVALEARPYIFPNQIQKSLNSILREWSLKYDDDERNISVHPQLEVLAIKSETLEEILKTGKITGIKLVKNIPVNQGQDESPFVCTARSELNLKPPRKIHLSIDKQLSGFRSVVKSRKSEYDLLKVTVDINGASKTNEYELSTQTTPEELLQSYFFHKEVVIFDENIVDANYDKVIHKIVEKVLNEVLTNEKLKISG
ncbi:TPA: hypothetical protein PNN92_000375 [Legionella pneumophila]|nr:hypothetical protein [Legionella pneumophila]HDI4380925.1 hypothetical protein [Legionella pneumophila]HDI4384406.1 hypothetical protein [Legionella pneumophila]HDI4387318.1 hypothetical protein [Legionella pneumophila]HDI4399862.1 hypothetical protein [Legionella pneumophila]